VDEITDALQAMKDGLDVSPVITHKFGIDDAQKAMQTAADPAAGSSKVMLRLS
jgi:L-idonate 5-dehydrogenase